MFSVTKKVFAFSGLGALVLAAAPLAMFCGGLTGCGGGGASSSPPPPVAANITWSTSSVEPILSPGESGSSNVTFRSDQSFQNATIEASGSIASLVTITPNSIANVPAGQDQAVKLTFSIPAGTALGTVNGTIQVKVGGQVLSQTISIAVDVWQAVTASSAGVDFKVPSFGKSTHVDVSQNDRGATLIDFQIYDDTLQDFLSAFGLVVYTNPSGVSLGQWFQQNVDINNILTQNGTFEQGQLPNGLTDLSLVGPIPAEYADLSGPVEEAYAISASGDRIISITQSQESRLSLLGYSHDGAITLMKQILGTVRFH